MIYFILFFILFFMAYIGQRGANNRLWLVTAVLLILFSGFRSKTVGFDTNTGYYENYMYVVNGSSLPWLETGWYLLNKICVLFSLGYQGVLFIASVLIISPVIYVISKTCKNKFFALAVWYGMFFLLYSFNLMRQCVAVSWCLLAMYFFNDKKIKNAVFCFVIAYLFHKTAVLVLVYVMYRKVQFTKFLTVLICTGTLMIGVFVSKELIFKLSGDYAKLLTATDGYSGFRSEITVPVLLAAAVNAFFLFIMFTDFDKVKKNPWFFCVIMGLCVMNMTVRLGQGTRMVLYFSQAQALFIPEYFEDLKIRFNKRLLSVLFIVYLAVNFVRVIFPQWENYNPYENVLFHRGL